MDFSSSSILHFHGPPGSGRSAIASHIVSNISKSYPDAIVTSFSSSRGPLGSPSITSFYVSMIRQLLLSQPSLFRRISALCDWINREYSFSDQRLRSLVFSLLKGCSKSPVISIIRGTEKEAPVTLATVVNLMRSHRATSTSNWKVVFLGEEPKHDVSSQASDICVEFNLFDKPWHSTIVEPYIKSRFETLVHQRPEWRSFEDSVIERLSTSTTFLQARLGMRLLETSRIPSTLSAVAERVKSLPGSVSDIYEQALNNCQTQCPVPLPYLLQWIYHSARVLSVNELSAVMVLASFETPSIKHLKTNTPMSIHRDLEAANDTLISVYAMQVYPIHESIEFISTIDGDPDYTILLGCLNYLETIIGHLEVTAKTGYSTNEPNLDSLEGVEFNLLGYAVPFWPVHYRKAKDRRRSREHLLRFLGKEENREIWSHLYRKNVRIPKDEHTTLNTGLKIAAKFGLVDIVEEAIRHSKTTECFGEDISEALDLAAANGHRDIVRLLLDEGAQSSEAMHLATNRGSMSTLDELAHAKPEMVNAKDSRGRTPLMIALLSGNEEVASYLLEKGASSDIGKEPSITACHLAAKTGQISTLHLLLAAGVDITAISRTGTHPLGIASAGGFDDIVRLLITNGADIDAQDADGMTALHFAIKHGHFSTSTLLVESGASIQKQTERGLSPVHLASREGFLDILKYLASKCNSFMDETTSPDTGALSAPANASAGALSPLQSAALKGHVEVSRELLSYTRYSSEADRAVALRIAAEGGFSNLVELLLETGYKSIAKDRDGNTALHLASKGQYPDIISQLLASTINPLGLFDINAANNDGWTALHFAAQSGRLPTLRVLLRFEANMEMLTNTKSTALHIAAELGYLHIIHELLGYVYPHNANIIFMEDNAALTPFALAVKKGHVDVVQALLQTSPREPLKLQGQINALEMAIENSQEDIVTLLVEQGWDVNPSTPGKTTPLHLASKQFSSSMVKLLISHGADVDAKDDRGESPLHYATKYGRVDIIKELLEGRADVNDQDNEGVTPLWLAAWSGQIESIRELLKWSPELNQRKAKTGWSALHACYDNIDITQELIQAGTDPNALNESGHPPYFLAADYPGGDNIMQCYIDAGVDITISTAGSMTALHIAASNGVLDTVKLLVQQGADVNATNDDFEAPIHLAAHQDQYDVVEYLLDQGADVDTESLTKGTPLIAAASNGGVDTVALLLDEGADVRVNATSEKSPCYTALQAAALGGFEDILRMLLDNGADANITGGCCGSPLCAAIMSRNIDVVSLVLDAGAEIDSAEGPRGTALQLALAIRFRECVDLLLKRGADVNKLGKGRHGTALIAAIDRDDLESVNKLLERGADIELCHPDKGELPIQVAIRKGMRTVFEALLRFNPDTRNKDKLGRGALSQCIAWKSGSLLPLLLDNPQIEIDINEQDASGQTPLMLAILSAGVNVVRGLMNSNPNLNQQDQWGKTALIYAACRDYGPVVSALLKGGANPLIKDKRGRDALYWASLESHRGTAEVIFQSILARDGCQQSLQHALNAAVAVHNRGLVDKILKATPHNDYAYADEDGWTAMYTAERYQHADIISLIDETAKNEGNVIKTSDTCRRLPTEWHLHDMAVGLRRQPDIKCITVDRECPRA